MRNQLPTIAFFCLIGTLGCGGKSPAPTAPSPSPSPAPAPTPTPAPSPTPSTLSLTGTVSSITGPRISGATVTVLDGLNAGRSATTNSNGDYRFDDMQPGNGNFSARAAGYLEDRRGIFVSGTVALNFVLQPIPGSRSIVVDGNPADWGGIAPLLTDPTGDGPFNGSGQYFAGEDFEAISVTNDAANVYLLMQFAGSFSGGIIVPLDTDDNPSTGCNGSEYALFVTGSEPSGAHLGLADYRTCNATNSYPGTVRSAAGGRYVEAAIPISILRVLTPAMTAFRISARAISPGAPGVVENVGPPALYRLVLGSSTASISPLAPDGN